MERTERFRSLDDVRMRRERMRIERAQHLSNIKQHWSTLGEGGFRSGVVNGAVRNLWNAWQPLDTLRTIAGNGTDLGSTLLGMALGSKARTPWGRALIWAAGATMPMLLERMQENQRVQHILVELQRSWARIRERMRSSHEASQ